MKSILKNITTALLVAIMCLISLIEAQEKSKENQKGYRIEADVFPIGNDQFLVKPSVKEIRFVSPEGKIIRTLPFDYMRDCGKILISPTFTYLLKAEDTPGQLKEDSLGRMEQIKEARVEFSYINAKGEEKWKKDFQIIYTLEETDEDDVSPYFFNFSHDGSKIVFVRNHSVTSIDYLSDITVLDTLGNEVASAYDSYPIENSGSLEISPDGKIVGSVTGKEVNNKRLTHLFFLEVETGRTKIGKAVGEGWRVDFVLSSSPTPPKSGKIRLNWQPTGKNYVRKPGGGVITKEVTFDELPDDLSVLFK